LSKSLEKRKYRPLRVLVKKLPKNDDYSENHQNSKSEGTSSCRFSKIDERKSAEVF